MDNLIRLLAYLIVGAALLYCNILYIRALRLTFEPGDYVIMPIKLVGQGDKDGSRGIALAQMLQARIKNIEGSLADAEDQLSTPQTLKSPVLLWPSMARMVDLSERKGMPISIFEPANINVAVGGVKVGGVIPWIQNLVVRKRTLTFTFYVVDKDKTIVSGNAKPLSDSGSGAIWFESRSEDEAISELSWALLLTQTTSADGRRIDKLLSRAEFQRLGDGLVGAAGLHREVAAGITPRREEFGAIFEKIRPVARDVADWPELKYFAADLAEKAGKMEDALILYKAFKAEASPKLAGLVKDEELGEKIASLSASLAGPASSDKPFDVPTTREGSTEHGSVNYETSLGGDGSRIAQAVMGRFDDDIAALTEIFGGTRLPKPFDVVIKKIDPNGEGLGGAYHYSCSDQTLYCDAKTKPALDPEMSSFLLVSQAADVFGAVQNKGWACGSSNGAGLKRVLAASRYPHKVKGWETAAIWLDTPDRPDWVNKSDHTDINAVATGCAVLFLNYLHSQLNIPWQKIVQAGGSNLGETYANLGLGRNGFVKFRQLLDKHFPIGKPSQLTTDNPFPL
jgi:hypothetical protein